MTDVRPSPVIASLLPCPFCGKEPVFLASTENDDFVRCYEVRCDHCGIEVSEEYKSETIERWNTRAAHHRLSAANDSVWTPQKFWEYVEGLTDSLVRDQIRDMLASTSLTITNVAQPPSIDLMQRVWANLYYNEEDAGNTFQQTLNEVVDWLAARNALPEAVVVPSTEGK